MAFSARILKDSISEAGHRLTTMEVTFPRIILAEFNTHRAFSRNSASSRAIPVEKMLKKVEEDPFVPVHWGKNQKGMQANDEVSPELAWTSEVEWLSARDAAVKHAKELLKLGIHKQITNRLLEPWLWHTVIVTATEWSNFFALRCHPDAQPEIQRIARMMKELHDASKPRHVDDHGWHLPLVDDHQQLIDDGFSADDIARISVGRCARVSYLTHDGKRDPNADIELAERLKLSGHSSPWEHVGQPMERWWLDEPGLTGWDGNFYGWHQLRKTLLHEDDFGELQRSLAQEGE